MLDSNAQNPSQVKIEVSRDPLQEQKEAASFLTEHKALLLQLLHLCAWNQIGVLLRVELSALFGGACGTGAPPWQPCVTSPGLTRLGGALFVDMPPNVLGSFAIGLFSSSSMLAKVHPTYKPIKIANIAFLPPNSPLQLNSALHLGLRTGLCGSLTTFASWILQMVKMMIGGSVTTLGTEWVAALWGIYVNVALSLLSLVLGQHLAIFLSNFYEWLEKRASDAEASGPEDAKKKEHITADKEGSWPNTTVDILMLTMLLTLTGVSLAYAITDGESSESPYSERSMWFSILLGPSGCIARWLLSLHLNAGLFESQWFYWGTWTANIAACIIDFICGSILARVSLTSLQSSLLNSIVTGISGSLSTVSTWVVELQTLGLKPGSETYIYALGSIIPAIGLGIIIYGSSILTL